MTSRKEVEDIARALSKKLADDGKLIEAGWVILRGMAVPPDAPLLQLNEMRMAYMAGAQHLYSSLMTIMDAGTEPTAADLRRMELIHNELEAFRKEMEMRKP